MREFSGEKLCSEFNNLIKLSENYVCLKRIKLVEIGKFSGIASMIGFVTCVIVQKGDKYHYMFECSFSSLSLWNS